MDQSIMRVGALAFLCFFAWTNLVYAQSGSDFDRKALSFVWGLPPNLPSAYTSWTQKYAQVRLEDVQERFERMALSQEQISWTEGQETVATAEVQAALMASGLPNELMGKIWSRKPDGRLGMEYLMERAEANASDYALFVADGTFRDRAAIHDYGESLINQSYIAVMVPEGIQTMKEYYDERDDALRKTAKITGKTYEPVERTKEGYQGKVNLYIFQLVFDEETQAHLYENLWVDENTPEEELTRRKALFDQYAFQVKPIKTLSSGIRQGTQSREIRYDSKGNPLPRKSREELFAIMMQNGWQNALYELDGLFVLRQALFAVDPPRAKLGEKEGLLNDRRFNVYEYRLRSDGTQKKKRVGVVRSTTKRDRSLVSSTERATTVFYQTSGRKLDKGMLLEEQPRMGLGAGAFAYMGSFNGMGLKADFRLSMLYSKYLSSNLGFELPPGLMLSIGLIQANAEGARWGEVPFLVEEQVRVFAELSKNFHPHRKFIVRPGLAVGLESIEDFDSSFFVGPALAVGTPLGANAEFLINTNYQFTTSQDYYDARGGLSIGLELRFDLPF